MKMKIKYRDEPKEGLELPESGYEVLRSSVVSKKWREISVSGQGYDKMKKSSWCPREGESGRGLVGGALAMCACNSPYILPNREKIEALAKLKKSPYRKQ
jgi:hypothetical protein